jgi:hypothetical protein
MLILVSALNHPSTDCKSFEFVWFWIDVRKALLQYGMKSRLCELETTKTLSNQKMVYC